MIEFYDRKLEPDEVDENALTLFHRGSTSQPALWSEVKAFINVNEKPSRAVHAHFPNTLTRSFVELV